MGLGVQEWGTSRETGRAGGEGERTEGEEDKPPWTRTTWPGETTMNKGSYSWEISQYGVRSAQSRHIALIIIPGLCIFTRAY